jgi:plasmid stabilization system protein ParE
MEFRVELSPRAFNDIDGLIAHIQQGSSSGAEHFRRRLLTKIGNLAHFPRGYSRAPEDAHCSFEVRQTFVGRYRILFTIRDQDALVYVLTVRHGARREMPADELDEAAES